MSSKLATMESFFRKYGYVFAAFLIPFLIRSIPEILSWPYPLGLDTLYVIPKIQQNFVFSIGIIGFLQNTNLFYLLSSLPYELFHNVFIVIKIFGPLLLAALSFTMYLYARRGLCWSNRKSLLVALLVATYFVSLRDSWDLYRQTLGLVFLMATLISLKTFKSSRKYYVASFFMVLTVFSHELVSVIMFFVIVLEASRFLVKGWRRDSVYLLSSVVLPAFFFLFERYSPQQIMGIIIPSGVASGSSINLILFMAGLLIYCYAIILPLVILGINRLKGLGSKILDFAVYGYCDSRDVVSQCPIVLLESLGVSPCLSSIVFCCSRVREALANCA